MSLATMLNKSWTCPWDRTRVTSKNREREEGRTSKDDDDHWLSLPAFMATTFGSTNSGRRPINHARNCWNRDDDRGTKRGIRRRCLKNKNLVLHCQRMFFFFHLPGVIGMCVVPYPLTTSLPKASNPYPLMINWGPKQTESTSMREEKRRETNEHPETLVARNVASNGKLKTIFEPNSTLLWAIWVVPSSRP